LVTVTVRGRQYCVRGISRTVRPKMWCPLTGWRVSSAGAGIKQGR